MEDLHQSLNRALSERRCALAHDLNDDLGIIAAYCELMLEKAEPNSQSAERLQLILAVVHRLAKRINGHDCRFAKASESASSIAASADLRQPVHARSQCLRSWKDIAQYVGACVKTVQRWEQTHNFPVRRVVPSKGAVVFAMRDDVDRWLGNQSLATKMPAADERKSRP